MHEYADVCVPFDAVLKENSQNTTGDEGQPCLPPAEKVKLFNINSYLGHHADYPTTTILRSPSRPP